MSIAAANLTRFYLKISKTNHKICPKSNHNHCTAANLLGQGSCDRLCQTGSPLKSAAIERHCFVLNLSWYNASNKVLEHVLKTSSNQKLRHSQPWYSLCDRWSRNAVSCCWTNFPYFTISPKNTHMREKPTIICNYWAFQTQVLDQWVLTWIAPPLSNKTFMSVIAFMFTFPTDPAGMQKCEAVDHHRDIA